MFEAAGLGGRLKHKPSITEWWLAPARSPRYRSRLAFKPSIIIADEPTGNLDSARGKKSCNFYGIF